MCFGNLSNQIIIRLETNSIASSHLIIVVHPEKHQYVRKCDKGCIWLKLSVVSNYDILPNLSQCSDLSLMIHISTLLLPYLQLPYLSTASATYPHTPGSTYFCLSLLVHTYFHLTKTAFSIFLFIFFSFYVYTYLAMITLMFTCLP